MSRRLEISGPYILHWEGLRESLESRQIALGDVRYIEALMSDEFIPDAPGSLTGKSRKVVHATIVLHTSERIPIGEVRMIYDGNQRTREDGVNNEPL